MKEGTRATDCARENAFTQRGAHGEALRKKRLELVRLMEVFLSEPIVDWEAHTRRLSEEQKRKLEEDLDAATQREVPLTQSSDANASQLHAPKTAASRATGGSAIRRTFRVTRSRSASEGAAG